MSVRSGGVNADGKFVADSEFLPTEIERLASEDMNIDGLAQSWDPATARECYVDTRERDRRAQLVATLGFRWRRRACGVDDGGATHHHANSSPIRRNRR
jgi:hypothetical protein